MLVTLVALSIGDVRFRCRKPFGSRSSLTPVHRFYSCMSYVYRAWRWRYWPAAGGMAGLIMQTLVRNPLASPDTRA
jgi:iron complex transport system permease protein